MIRWVNIVGAQCIGTHVQHGQRPQEWGPPQCKYYGSVKHNDPAAYRYWYHEAIEPEHMNI